MAYAADQVPAHAAGNPARLGDRDHAAKRWGAIGWGLAWGALVVVVLLGARAPAQRTGDAHQYHAMAGALADLRPPALTSGETAAYKAWLGSQPVASGFPSGVPAVDQPALVRGERQEFSHFWVYPLLAAPFVAAGDALGLHRADAFLAANALMLGSAVWAIGRWSRPVVALLLLGSPLVWFVDKAQVEVFTVASLALAMVAAGRGAYLWAAFFGAVASTQNLPIAAAVPLFWAAGLLRALLDGAGGGSGDRGWGGLGRGQARRSAPTVRWLCATYGSWGRVVLVAATVAVAGLHPAYYRWRLGVVTPQELNGGIAAGVPSPARYLAPLVDPNLGLLPWTPLLGGLALVGAGLLAWPGRGEAPWRSRDLRVAGGCAALLGGWFLAACAQTSNVNSGGTVHLSRYALWLLPLTIPFLEAASRWLEGRLPGLLPAVGVVSFVGYAVLFRPGQPERYVVPSPQAEWAAVWLGGRYRPVPEVFFERERGVDGGVNGSAANGACTLVLLSEGAPEPACPPTEGERAEAVRLFGQGWRSVWVGRPGRLGVGGEGVEGAVRR